MNFIFTEVRYLSPCLRMYRRSGFLSITFLFVLLSVAEVRAQYDTSFYVSYDTMITGRVYFSKKFTTLNLSNRKRGYSLNYRPNTTLNMGVGATYKWATVNLAFGFDFLNPDNGKGKTKYLDLQFHGYGRKVVVDFFGQFYRGFYLVPKGYGLNREDRYYIRPDIHLNEIGISAQYIFNSKQLSYRASYFQNEWQKKSAGSFLAGLEIYGGNVDADSSMVPSIIEHSLSSNPLMAIGFFNVGVNSGYVYTWVFKEHLFLTGSLSLSLAYASNKWTTSEDVHVSRGVSPNTFFRFFIGYNSSVWGASIGFVSNQVFLISNKLDNRVSFNTGNFRMSFIYRFQPGKRAKEVLKIIDKISVD